MQANQNISRDQCSYISFTCIDMKDIHIYRQTDRQTDKHIYINTYRKTDIYIYIYGTHRGKTEIVGNVFMRDLCVHREMDEYDNAGRNRKKERKKERPA